MISNHDKIRLRWRYDFADSRTKYGQWSLPASRPEDMAAMQHRDGLIRASIEAQCVYTEEVSTIAEADGWDFVNFKWLCASHGVPASLIKVIGLTLVTRDHEVVAYTSGESRLNVRPESDKNFNYSIFGK